MSYRLVATDETDLEQQQLVTAAPLNRHESRDATNSASVDGLAASASSSSLLDITLLNSAHSPIHLTVPADTLISSLISSHYADAVSSSSKRTVSVIYMGRRLPHSATLSQCNMESGHCLHVFISQNDRADETDGIPTAFPVFPSVSHGFPLSSPTGYAGMRSLSYSAGGGAVMVGDADSHIVSGIDLSGESAVAIGAQQANFGTNRDLIYGFLLGMTFGLLSVIFLWHPGPSTRFKFGIMIGFLLNLLMFPGRRMQEPHTTGDTTAQPPHADDPGILQTTALGFGM